MVTSAERRTLLTKGAAVPSTQDAMLTRLVATIAQHVKARLPQGWDVTLLVTRHHGNGTVNVKQSSTLPPHVARATLQALAFASDDAPSATDNSLSQPTE